MFCRPGPPPRKSWITGEPAHRALPETSSSSRRQGNTFVLLTLGIRSTQTLSPALAPHPHPTVGRALQSTSPRWPDTVFRFNPFSRRLLSRSSRRALTTPIATPLNPRCLYAFFGATGPAPSWEGRWPLLLPVPRSWLRPGPAPAPPGLCRTRPWRWLQRQRLARGATAMAVAVEGARRKERILCLFDVDGTLTPARQVRAPRFRSSRPESRRHP